jgi:hypothetical protein
LAVAPPNFTTFQSSSTRRLQLAQQQSLGITAFQQNPTSFEIWFGTQGSRRFKFTLPDQCFQHRPSPDVCTSAFHQAFENNGKLKRGKAHSLAASSSRPPDHRISWAVQRQVDEKRPTRAVKELHQVAATRTERRQPVQVTSPKQISGSPVRLSVRGTQSRSDGDRSLTVGRPESRAQDYLLNGRFHNA